jgi:S1-C subfamily serine protease
MSGPRRAALAALAALACSAAAAACGADRPAGGPRPPVVRVAVATGVLVPHVATGAAIGDGRVLTVAHVLAGGRVVDVAGRHARVVRVDRRLDLALLAVPGLRAPAVRLGGEARQIAVAVVRDGRARPLPGSVRRRVVVRWREQPGDPPRLRPGLELAAAVQPGDSGAPVVDRDGRLLGVVYARASVPARTAWAVDASAVRAFLARTPSPRATP